MKPNLTPGLLKAQQIAARVASPVGKAFAAKREKKTCRLYLYDAIGLDMFGGGISPQSVVDALDAEKDADSLEVYVNSPGGGAFDGIAIFNAIRRFNGPKTVFVDGIAASIASVIALSGDKIVTNEGATWMIHDPWSGIFAVGTADQIEDAARKQVQALRKIRETLVDIYVNATGRSVAEISAWMTAETWMTAEEALDRGFTDEVSKSAPASPAASASRAAARPPPHAEAEMARAKVRELSTRFAGASPGASGRPGTSNLKPGDRQIGTKS